MEGLKEVLVSYASADPEVGYVQGMNFVAGALVYHLRCPSDCLRVFTFIMVDC